MLYTHVLNRSSRAVRSPGDMLDAAPGDPLDPSLTDTRLQRGNTLTGGRSLTPGRMLDGRFLKAPWRDELRD